MNKSLKAMMLVVALGFVPNVFGLKDGNNDVVATNDAVVSNVVASKNVANDIDIAGLKQQVDALLKLVEAQVQNKITTEIIHVNGHNNSMSAIIKDEISNIFRTAVRYTLLGTMLVGSATGVVYLLTPSSRR